MDKELIRQELRKELARREYIEYCTYVHGDLFIVGKAQGFIAQKINSLMADELLTEDGQPVKILCLSMPPQHGKSVLITQTFPSYYFMKHPDDKTIIISYGDDLARLFGRKNKEKIKEFGAELFGYELGKNTDTDMDIKGHRGSIISRGIMAGITGQSADLIIIDDPIKSAIEANSEVYRNRIWEEFLNSIYTRLSAKGKIVIIQTRWNEDDLIGRVMNELSDKSLYINIPLEAEENDPLGRAPGDSLFPEIGKDKNWLESTKKVYMTKEGQRSWLALYQGRPTAQGGNLIKRDDFKYYSIMPEKFDQILQSWDCTFKDSDGSDYVVGQVWGRKGPDKYLLDMVRARMDFPTTMKAILNMTMKWPQAYMKVIEDKANGSAIIQVLSKKIEGIMPVTPRESKLARVQSILPQIECGNVYLPSGAAWLEEFIDECCKFPNGKHDDMVDAMSQALSKMLNDYTFEVEEKVETLPEALRTEEDYQCEGGYMDW